jgi:hypothetical protein
LKAILGQREYRVIAVDRRPVQLPLFVLAAPPVSGASVTYVETVSTERSFSWSITAFGTGTGFDRTVTASAATTFAARDGDRQLIFLPAVFEIADVEVLRRGEVLGRGPRTQLVSPTAGDIVHQACRPLPADEWVGEPDPDAPRELPFELSEARPTDTPTSEERWQESKDMSLNLGLKAFNLAANCAVKVRRVREVKLTFVLPGGTTYQVRRLRNPEGLDWQVT